MGYLLAAEEKKVRLVSKLKLKLGLESEPACRYSETWLSPSLAAVFQCNSSQLNEKDFIYVASKSVFQGCVAVASCKRFLGIATIWIYYILFIFKIFF